jgi:hypothetical protein
VLPIGIWIAVDQSTSGVFDAFNTTGEAPDVSSVRSGSSGTASATFSGAITGPVDGTVTTVGGTSGPCISRAADVSGFTFLHTTDDGAASQTITVVMTYPQGQKGVTTLDLATTPFGINASYAATPDPATGGVPAAQSWTPGPGTTGTFELTSVDAGHLVVDNLVPAAPAPAGDALGEPLSVVIDFTCS